MTCTWPLLIVVHMFIVDVKNPAAASAFNEKLFSILTFDIVPPEVTFDKFTEMEPEAPKDDLEGAGYESTSPVRNLGSVFIYMILLPTLVEMLAFIHAKLWEKL